MIGLELVVNSKSNDLSANICDHLKFVVKDFVRQKKSL